MCAMQTDLPLYLFYILYLAHKYEYTRYYESNQQQQQTDMKIHTTNRLSIT